VGGGRRREGEGGGREEWIRELGVFLLDPGSWILDGNKVKIRYTGSGVGMNSLALFFKSLETILTYNLDAAIRYIRLKKKNSDPWRPNVKNG
jgi:hypothetical protein